MKNIAILIERDFNSRVKTKSYIISTVLGVFLIIALAFIPVAIEWIENRFEPTDIHILLLDKTNTVATNVYQVLEQQYQDSDSITVTTALGTSEADAVEQMHRENKSGILVIDYDESGNLTYTLHTDDSSNMNQNNLVQRIINQANTQFNAQQLNLSVAEVTLLMQTPYLHVRTLGLSETDGLDQGEEIVAEDHWQSLVLAYFLLFVLYMALILYGNMVASGVAEEKSSRIMEVMVSMVKPLHLMIGKIVGIGALGLLQFSIWIGTGLIVITMRNFGFSLGSIPIATLIWFAVLFVLGYLFYATIFAAAGALVSRVEDVQQIVSLITMAMVVGFFVAYMSFLNPNGTLATIGSMIPFLSPMVLFARVTLANPPVIQIIASLVLLLAGIMLNIWIAAKIYQVGVLMYGKRPTLKEVMRYIVN